MTELEQAEKNLADYVATLSPEKQIWANNFRQTLNALPTVEERVFHLFGCVIEQNITLQNMFVSQHIAKS
jgi:hypothetical protein